MHENLIKDHLRLKKKKSGANTTKKKRNSLYIAYKKHSFPISFFSSYKRWLVSP